ncbi:MAG: hypothetical protein GTN62_00835 [Gemmatimonadales bacterium]|nr:hypothetical protein [Gemmatimonadales bacterium]NIN48648.1 hypothetical protein [Gemmatimonadales bacterium]NIP06112.1 hypothetical protein [Gemmatimonadales bacterium]NIR01286.1 hypothetical protein [Gemmatimonadales bacterium]
MGAIAPFLVPITLFLTIGAVVILRGPLGKALGERLAGHRASLEDAAESEALRAEVDELRYRVSELEERLDFTERVLAQHKQPGQLPGGE